MTRFADGRYTLGAVLGVTLGLVLLGCVLTGHPEYGGPSALGFVLTAVPTLAGGRVGMHTIVVRGGAGVAAVIATVLLLDHDVRVGPFVIAVAAVGTLTRVAASTPALAAVLTVAAFDHGSSVPSWMFVALYAAGALLVASAFGVFWLFSTTDADRAVSTSPDWSYTISMTIGVGIAVCLQAVLPDAWEGGHWLVTCVILTLQATPAATRHRLRKRLTGNALGAVVAAVVLASAPVPVVTVLLIAALFFVAFAMRPIDYFWWAITAPPLLLLTGTFPHLYPWYEGAIRLAMNLVGAAIVVGVAFAGPQMIRWAREG